MKKILSTILAVFILALAPYALAQYVQPHTATAAPQIIDNPSQQTTINSMQVPRVICQSAVPQLIYAASGWTAAPTTIATLASCTVPAGAMGLNGALRISTVWSFTNSANNKSLYENFNTTNIANWGMATNATFVDTRILSNRNSASSQMTGYASGGGPFGASAAAVTTLSINTTTAQTVSFLGTTSVESGISQTALTGNGTSCSATVASGAYAVGDYVIVASGSGCGSGSQNTGATPVAVTASNGSTTYSYPCTCNGGSPTGGSGQRYSRIQLESYCVELIPGVN